MYSVENQEKFAGLLCERNWSDVLSSEDPQSAYSLFSQGYIDMSGLPRTNPVEIPWHFPDNSLTLLQFSLT